MPSLGADMEVGTILEWRVHPGDVVHSGDIVALVDTEKSDIEVEVFEDGVIEELLVEVGREVAVGTPLARIGTGTTPTAPSALTSTPSRRRRPEKVAAEHVRASPRARKEATEHGIDLTTVAGSGPAGAVVAADVGAGAGGATPAPTARAPRPPRGTTDRHTALRRATGELMARSKREIPHFYLATTIDLSATMTWLADENAGRPVTRRLLPAALLLKASAAAAREVPALNGFWDDGPRPSPSVHLGVAVSLRGGGLVAPAIRDADRLSVEQLMAALQDLVRRSRAGTLRSSEVSGATMTVTNLGENGVDEVYGVIHPPQVALVGFGTVADRPWATDGLLGVRPTVRATLAADHRVSDGLEGSRFLTTIDRLLQTPEEL